MSKDPQNKERNENLISVRQVIAVNCFDLAPCFVLEEDRHSFWEFVYIDSGEVLCRTEGKEQLLKQGDIIFHRPHEIHSTICNGKLSAAIINVIFDCDSNAMERFIDEVMRLPGSMSGLLIKMIDECNQNYYVSKYPLREKENPPLGGQQLVRLYIEEFLLLLLRVAEENTLITSEQSVKEQTNDSLVEEICLYLSENICQKITLASLTERFHFGKSYLCEQFKRCKGISIMNYLLELRLTEAKRMLREEPFSVHEISERLGFESPEYFSRYFHKKVGRSPRDFRNMLISAASVKRSI